MGLYLNTGIYLLINESKRIYTTIEERERAARQRELLPPTVPVHLSLPEQTQRPLLDAELLELALEQRHDV